MTPSKRPRARCPHSSCRGTLIPSSPCHSTLRERAWPPAAWTVRLGDGLHTSCGRQPFTSHVCTSNLLFWGPKEGCLRCTAFGSSALILLPPHARPYLPLTGCPDLAIYPSTPASCMHGLIPDLHASAGVVKIWSTQTGQLLHSLDGPGGAIEWLQWHPRGDVVVAGVEDFTIWMWNAQTGACMQVCRLTHWCYRGWGRQRQGCCFKPLC